MEEQPIGKRQAAKNKTRKQLIDTAMQQFAKNGIMATTTSDIAKAANVAHGTVFVHFPTQEALLNTVIEEFGTRVSQRLHELAAGSHSLRDVLTAHLQGLSEFEPFYIRLVAEGRLFPNSARNVFTVIQSSVSFHMIQAAEKEIREGSIEPYPAHLLFNTWIGLLHYYLANSDLFAPQGSVLERYGQELLDHYMHIISIKKV